MLKGFALLLLSVTVAHTYPQLSGLTTYEMMPDVTTDEMVPGVLEDEPSEEQTNDIIPDEYDPQKHSGEHEDLLEVTAKCGYTSDSKETTLESVSWKAEFEEIAQNIRLFAERCGSLRSKAQNLDSEWENYKTKYGKSYESPEEDSTRRELYFKNKAEIEAHNLLYRKGLTSYSMGLNHFSDMRFEEMGAMLGSTEESYGNISAPNVDIYVPSNLTLPFSVDWRRKGAVTGVKSQGKCGSCWAFSTTGAIEGQWKIHKGRLLSLSEQQLVDCSHANPNKGCKYGNVISALKDIRRSGGIESEQAYPYKSRSSGREGKCRFNRRKVVATVRGWAQLPSGNEAALRDAVANKGPVSVMIHLSKKFSHYRSGIFDEPHCKGTNHIMLAVGYGVQKGHSYWLIKNSWGSGWGSGGYVMMSRNKGNQCMIATHACYPVV